ncbi:hypothetical protein H8S75_13395 [Hungatella sp. L12]|uniref:Tyr recombinase domain-containing protein n=1 Tax=Hungatella hominis TaxID=2763050 RepID=A0ABR7H779_9FIRM|nr:hypothetical protein [Hungatella hominis]MBC5708948.1 hypothetical protein [Hungatella hominis]
MAIIALILSSIAFLLKLNGQLFLIITATTGCRVSELIAIKFTAVNIKKCKITIKNQLGRKIDDSDVETGEVYKQTLKTKSHAGERKSTIPEFVVEEILVAKERYDYWKSITQGFQDNGYIWVNMSVNIRI